MTAELLQFQLLRHGLLVLRRRVVPTFALGTLKGDDFSACARHVFATPLVTFRWSPLRELNSRPRPYQGRALPLS